MPPERAAAARQYLGEDVAHDYLAGIDQPGTDDAHRRPLSARPARAEPQLPKEGQPCHSPASNSSPSRSTVSAPAKVRVSTHRSATPGRGCMNGCSPPGGGAIGSVSLAVAAASTTPSCGCTILGSAPRSWVPGSSARPDGTRTGNGRAGGVP